MIRAIVKRDLKQIEAIHKKFYEKEFPLSDLQRFICSFAVVDDESERVITAGGIRAIVEAVMVTDKDVEIHQRRLAMLQMLTAAEQTTRMAGYDSFHVYIQDTTWYRHLMKYGFRPTVGQPLVISV